MSYDEGSFTLQLANTIVIDHSMELITDAAGRLSGFAVQKNRTEVEPDHVTVIEIGDMDEAGSGGGGGGDRMRRVNYVNSLSAREMESLTALCDTFLPSVDPPGPGCDDESVAEYYRTSASMAGTPELVSVW